MIEYKRSDCNYKLSCRHCIGRNCREYEMDCIVLKQMTEGKLKILVFGDRNWNGHDEKSRIRYVEGYKVRRCSLNLNNTTEVKNGN